MPVVVFPLTNKLAMTRLYRVSQTMMDCKERSPLFNQKYQIQVQEMSHHQVVLEVTLQMPKCKPLAITMGIIFMLSKNRD